MVDEIVDRASYDAALNQLARLAGFSREAGTGVATSASEAARYRHLIEQIPAVTFTGVLDGGLREIYVSPQIEALLGFSQAEWVADPVLWYRQLHPADRDMWAREFARGCAAGGRFRADCRFLARDGRVVWVHGEARLVRDVAGKPLFLQGVAFDISEIKRAEAEIRASLREKELLLKEIHHRVKNNLQITSSLLKLQADQVADPQARSWLRASESRVRSMALLHELLYRDGDLARVDLGAYLREIATHLLVAHARAAEVRIDFAISGDVSVAIDEAVPCGLIATEVIANSLEHGLPAGRRGTIRVAIARLAEDRCRLAIADDGVGLPDDFDMARGSSLGLRLVRALTRQLDGTLEITNPGGCAVSLTFDPRGA